MPIVLSTFVLSSQVETANTIFNAVFFVVVVSAILQGTTLERVAQNSTSSRPSDRRTSLRSRSASRAPWILLDFVVAPDHAIAGSAVREVGLPRAAIIAVIVRGDDSIPPRGSTLIEPGDRLFVLVPHELRRRSKTCFRAGGGGSDRRYPGEMPKVEHLVYGDRKVFTVSAFNRGIGCTSAGCRPCGWRERSPSCGGTTRGRMSS